MIKICAIAAEIKKNKSIIKKKKKKRDKIVLLAKSNYIASKFLRLKSIKLLVIMNSFKYIMC